MKSGAAACTPRPRLIFTEENPIFRSKNRYLADFAPGNPKDFSKIGMGWQWRGTRSVGQVVNESPVGFQSLP